MDVRITSPQQRPLTPPRGSQEGLQIGSCWWGRLIGGGGGSYKWPSSNCLRETQHIRPTGLRNLGLIYLPRDACNPIPLHIHLHLRPPPSPPPTRHDRPSPVAFSPRRNPIRHRIPGPFELPD